MKIAYERERDIIIQTLYVLFFDVIDNYYCFVLTVPPHYKQHNK